MKQTLSLGGVIFLALLAFSCQKEIAESPVAQATKVYTFSVQDNEWTGDGTRTAYTPGVGLGLTNTELISLFYVDGSGYVVGSNMGANNSPGWKASPTGTPGEYSFTGPSLDGTFKCYAIMPYSYKNLTLLKKSTGNEAVTVGLSNVQYPADNSFDPHFDFMVGQPFDLGTDATVATVTSFKRLFSPLKISFSGLANEDKIYAATVKFSQNPSKTGNNNLVGLFQLTLSENYGEVALTTKADDSCGNVLTALYPEGLSKNNDIWPVWFLVNPITIASGTIMDITVSTANKTYRRSITLPSAAELQSNKFNELKVDVKGDGYEESSSYTQFFIPVDNYVTGGNSLTASDGTTRTWNISNGNNTLWDTSLSNRDNGSGVINGLYMYGTRQLTIPTEVGHTVNRITIYPHPNNPSYVSGDKYLLYLKDGSTSLITNYFALTSKSTYTGLYKLGTEVFAYHDIGGKKVVSGETTYPGIYSAITVELDKLFIEFEVSDGNSLVSPWPFSSPISSDVSATWGDGSSASFSDTETEFILNRGYYSFSIKGTSGIVRNSMAGLLVGAKTGDYVKFPAVPGMKLSKVIMRNGSSSGTGGKPAIKDTVGNLVTGGDAFTFSGGRRQVHSWSLSGTAANTSYCLTATEDVRIEMQKLTLVYIPE